MGVDDWQKWVEQWQAWAQRRLPGTRLGESERAVLLHAATAKRRGRGVKLAPLPRPGGDRSEDDEAAEVRAAAKLESLGLVDVLDSVRHVGPVARLKTKKRFRRQRGVVLTPLGEAVVATCRDQLENQAPLRWAKLMPEIKEQLAERNRTG